MCDALCFSLGLFWLSLTGLTGQRDRSDRSKLCCVMPGVDRSDRSVATALSSCLIVWITCHIASRIYLWCFHTLVAPHGCWDLGGVSFMLNMCNLACEAKLWWIPFICTYWGGAPTKSENSKVFIEYLFVSFNRVVINHQKGGDWKSI